MQNLANHLQLKHLRLMKGVADTGQLTLAADRLAMTQPAASRMLSEIERTVGMPVFARHSKGMVPTPAGEVLVRHASTILSALDETLREVAAIGSGLAGSVHVGAVTGPAVGFVVPAVQQLKEEAAGADIHVEVAPSDALVEGLFANRYDFVLSRIPAGVDPRAFDIKRGRVEIADLMVRRDHPLAGRRRVGLSELSGYRWVIQPPGTPLRQAVEDAFLRRNAPLPRDIMNTTSLVVMIGLISTSDTITPAPREVTEMLTGSSMTGELTRLALDEPIVVNPYHVLTRKDRVLGPLAQRLLRLIVERIAEA